MGWPNRFARGYDVDVRKPDADDPLGGVVDLRAPGADLVQLVNFLNPPTGGFPRLVEDCIGVQLNIGYAF